MLEIRLTDRQFAEAAQIGTLRQCNAISRGYTNRCNEAEDLPRDLWRHVIGALAEAAVAVALGKANFPGCEGGFWQWAHEHRTNTGIDDRDVGMFAVRYATKEHYSLIVSDTDLAKGERIPFVLVTSPPISVCSKGTLFTIRGFALAYAVKLLGEVKRSDRGPFYALAQSKLATFPPAVGDVEREAA